jgi:DUF1365 family protein
VRSGLYEGSVRHRRFAPVAHEFTYRVFMAYFDLSELDNELGEVLDHHPLWSSGRAPGRRRLASFSRSDYLGDPRVPLDEAVADLVEERLGRRPLGPIALLCNVRTARWNFNPIAIYYCSKPGGLGLDTVVFEVTNTPWNERVTYVVDVSGEDGDLDETSRSRPPRRPGVRGHLLKKELHVSPFLGMDLTYRFTTSEPHDRLDVRFGVFDGDGDGGGGQIFDVDLWLARTELTRRSLTSILLRYPLMPVKVSAAIYLQAARLWIKGTPFYRHPRLTRDTVDRERSGPELASPEMTGTSSCHRPGAARTSRHFVGTGGCQAPSAVRSQEKW